MQTFVAAPQVAGTCHVVRIKICLSHAHADPGCSLRISQVENDCDETVWKGMIYTRRYAPPPPQHKGRKELFCRILCRGGEETFGLTFVLCHLPTPPTLTYTGRTGRACYKQAISFRPGTTKVTFCISLFFPFSIVKLPPPWKKIQAKQSNMEGSGCKQHWCWSCFHASECFEWGDRSKGSFCSPKNLKRTLRSAWVQNMLFL